MNIGITATAMTCATGTHPMSLLGSVMTNSCSPLLYEQTDHITLAKPTYMLPVLDLTITDNKQRFTILLQKTLLQLLPHLKKSDPKKILLHLLLPAIPIDAVQIETIIKQIAPEFTHIQFKFSVIENNACQQLQSLCTEFETGNYDALIFGAVDSLIDPIIITNFANQKRLFTIDTIYGIVPGEAAAFILLQPLLPTSVAKINAIAGTTESLIQHADTHSMTGLTHAINQALMQSNQTATSINSIITPLGADPNDPLEWYQVTQAIWPNQLIPEELTLFQTLGAIGAATFPLNLIMGCARLKLQIPPAQQILICEASEYSHRGVVILSNSNV